MKPLSRGVGAVLLVPRFSLYPRIQGTSSPEAGTLRSSSPCTPSCPPPWIARRWHTSSGLECLREEILKEGARAAASRRWGEGSGERTGSITSEGSDTLASMKDRWISAQEVSHMESPEADEAHRRKVSKAIDDLFSRIPLPADPMAAALAPNAEEEQENAASEMLKEAVREAYWRKVNARRAEEARVEKAMERRFPGLSNPSSSSSIPSTGSREKRPWSDTTSTSNNNNNTSNNSRNYSQQKGDGRSATGRQRELRSQCSNAEQSGSEEQLRLELEAMKARVRELEAQLKEGK